MYRIGLTGGIASGKTTASRALLELGADVIDADEIARALTTDGGAAAETVRGMFGTLNRKEIGRAIFADASLREALNALVHPLVRREIERRLGASNAPVRVIDAPLLLESGMQGMADEIWVVYVSEAEQLERAMRRDGLSEAEARARIMSQMPTAEKLRLADEAIDASGPPEALKDKIAPLYRRALERAGGCR